MADVTGGEEIRSIAAEQRPGGTGSNYPVKRPFPLASLLGYLADVVARFNVGVLRKLLIGFLAGAMLLLGMAVLSLVVIGQMSQRVDDLTRLQTTVDSARDMYYLVTAQSHFRAMSILTHDEANNDKIAFAKESFIDNLNALEEASPPEQAGIFRNLRDLNSLYAESSTEALALFEAGEMDALMDLHLSEEHAISHELEAALVTLVGDASSRMIADKASFERERRLITGAVLGFSGVSLVSALFLGIVLSWSFTRPVRQIDNALKQIADGDFTQMVEVPNRDEFGTLTRNLNDMTAKLADSYRSLEEEKRTSEAISQALQNELEKGRQLQLDFLPTSLPQSQGWELQAILTPARDVSGDFYDAFTLPNGLIAIVIGDVCDKGVGSALFMALSRSLIRIFSGESYLDGTVVPANDPSTGQDSSIEQQSIAESVYVNTLNAVVLTNNYIAETHSATSMFTTLFFGVLDPATGALSYINGGHEAPIIVGVNGVKERLNFTGPAVGIMPDMNFDIRQTKLEPGDILIAYTDGVTDARNPEGESFTEQRLLSLVEEPIPSAAALLERIESSVNIHISGADQFDDITMLAVRRSPATAAS